MATGSKSNAYWWDDNPQERYWIEIRKAPGIGTTLRCPLTIKTGTKSGAYELVDQVQGGDVIYHWHAEQSRVGRSIAVSSRTVIDRPHRPYVGSRPLDRVEQRRQPDGRLHELGLCRGHVAGRVCRLRRCHDPGLDGVIVAVSVDFDDAG
jgi:hypothetical protein